MKIWMTMTLGFMASVACAQRLTEDSIRAVLTSRAEAMAKHDMEAAIGAYATNAMISVSFFGIPDATSDMGARELCEDLLEDLKRFSFTTDPLEININDGGTSAVVKAATRLACAWEEKRQRTLVFSAEETMEFAAAEDGPRIISGTLDVKNLAIEPDELSKRIMKLVAREGGLDQGSALELLEESGGEYREGDGDKKKTTVKMAGFLALCGDETAALAASFPNLQSLNLGLGAITDEGLAIVGRIPTLERFSVMGTSITDAGIEHLADLSELKSLELLATGITDGALERIAALPALESLGIMGAPKLTDAGLAHLANSATLTKLSLSFKMTDSGMERLAAVPNLRSLRINHAAVTDAGLASVEKMTNLTSISLGHTEVTHRGVKWLKETRPKLKIYPRSLSEPCADSRQQLEYAKKKWAENQKKKAGAIPSWEELEPFLAYRGGYASLTCEDGGSFSINPIGVGAECSIHGKTAPRKPVEPLKGLSKEDYDVDGAKLGRWTMDLDAAEKLAAVKQVPILINFTGSDWCYWCKLMEKNVFTKPEWNAYATNHVVMVLIDFPRDKSAVPDKYKERNNTLKKQYEISGYPTFVLLEADGETEVTRLKAGRDKTAESFIAEITKEVP